MPYLIIILIISIFICYEVYFGKVIFEKMASKKRQKIFELLQYRYDGLKENDLGFFEYSVNDKNLLFQYISLNDRNNSNVLIVYLDISTIEEDIKKLCKIHFYCRNIDGRDWVKMPVEVFFDTLNNLVKHSSDTVSKIISETDNYISEKRAQRNKL